MSQKASRLPTKTDRLLQNQKKVKDLYALNRLRLTPRTIQNPSGGSVGAGGDVSSAAESNSLKTKGDTMVGPIAFFPVDVFIDSTTDPANPSINIGEGASNPPDYSTYVLVTGGNPPTDLSTIFGAGFAGQMLKLQAIVDIVIKDAIANGSGNILTTTDQDQTLLAGSITEFLFDITAGPGGVNGAWRLASTGGAGTTEGSRLLTGLTGDDSTVGVIPWDNNFFFGDTTKITATATPGVYKLLQGDSYTMEALLQVEMVDSGGGSDLIFNWQEASAEGGPFTDVPNNQSVVGAMEIGKATITTQPHSIALVIADTGDVFVRTFSILVSGTFIRTIALSTIAEIETVGTGGSGTGGATTLDGLADVDFPTTPADTEVLTFNATSGFWENLPPASGGMNTNLSNMISPTLPTVALSMNNQDIVGIKNMDFDDVSSNIQGLKAINFFDSFNIIESSSSGLRYQAPSGGEHLFQGTSGFIAKFIEVNPTDHRLDMLSNRVSNIDKLQFSPVSSIDSSGIAEIYEETGFGNLRYHSNASHVFVDDIGTVQMTLGTFIGNGGFLQDISFFKMLASTPSVIAVDGEFQNVFQSGSSGPGDVLVHSGGQVRNLSDIQAGGGNEISQGNSFVRVSDVGTGAVNIEVDSVPIVSYTNTIGVVFEKTIQMNANAISSVGNINFANAFSVLNLNGSNISAVGKITSDDGKFNDDLEIDGALNHDGTTVGFFGVTPVTVPFMSRATSGDSLAVLIVRFQILQDILSQLTSGQTGNPSGVGIIAIA